MEGEIVDTMSDEQYEQGKQENEANYEREEQDVQSLQAKEAAPGAPIVRGNTPRPFMYSTMTAVPPSKLPEPLPEEKKGKNAAFSPISAFPTKPPSAPPLPEEPDEYDDVEAHMYTPSVTNKLATPTRDMQEFEWLFEYGLEMDNFHLNTPERLDGLALLYGNAVLKGYRLFLGSYEDEDARTRTLTAIVPDTRVDAEVWGVLYRVPRYVTQERSDEPALLETVHAFPQSGMREMRVEVLETYRNRTLSCITYGYEDASTAAQHLATAETQDGLAMYIRRLTSIATKQKLPDAYIKQLRNTRISTSMPITPSTRHEQIETAPLVATAVRTEQHTEPLMMSVEKLPKAHTSTSPLQARKSHPNRWFVAFAIYLFCLLLAVFALAVVQGMGIANDVLNDNFLLLHVPWLVLLYGLLGGCVSSIITLGRTSAPNEAPIFVVVTWFTRPFVGAVLALFAYLLLSSGLFSAVSSSTARPESLFLLVGALAGMCEGWLFLRKR